jgi:hypothetical protein
MRLRTAWLPLAILGLLLLPSAAVAGGSGHYVPAVGDRFVFAETTTVTNGQGNYSGYTDEGDYSGSITVTAVQPNGTESAAYQASGTYHNSNGQNSPWSESGSFTFSAVSFLYVQGTDNQTGYVNPYVWFYIDNSLGRGASFNLLNTPMTVVATGFPFPMASSSTGYVATIFAEGNGSYQRNDAYGNFAASYNWKAYFDPGTGYIVGYTYTEVDSDPAGDGFTYTDTLTDTQTTFGLTPTSAPPTSSSSSGSSPSFPLVIIAIVAVVVILILVVIIIALRHRSHRALPRHPSVPSGTMPTYAPPTPINLIPRDQPPVQQVVIRETVKVPCAYCGTLIDSTATTCPKCGATRT